MKLHYLATCATAAILAAAGATQASDMRQSPVQTHKSQGDVTVVAKATARMMADETGVFVNMDTTGLTPGNVHTLWFVAINNPEACGEECTSKDVLKRTDEVEADVGYAGGLIVGPDGAARFNYFQPVGALSGAWFTDGLKSTDRAEIHLVVNDHGPVLEGQAHDMLTTYRGGCADESIPAPMPDTARADGAPGPNQCRLVQFSIFKSADAQS